MPSPPASASKCASACLVNCARRRSRPCKQTWSSAWPPARGNALSSLSAREVARTVICVTETWQVEPSGPLRGDIRVRGSKNAVSKHMVATMLGDAPSTIRNAPEVGDVDITAAMLEAVGFGVDQSAGKITITQNGKLESRVPAAFTGLNRIAILMLGP